MSVMAHETKSPLSSRAGSVIWAWMAVADLLAWRSLSNQRADTAHLALKKPSQVHELPGAQKVQKWLNPGVSTANKYCEAKSQGVYWPGMSYCMSRKLPHVVNNNPFNSNCRSSTIWMRKEKNGTGIAEVLSSLNDDLRKVDACFCLCPWFQLYPLSQQYPCLNVLFLCLSSLFPEARNFGLTCWPCAPIVLHTSWCSEGPLSSPHQSHQLSLMMVWVAAIIVLGAFSRGRKHCRFFICQLPIFCQDTGPCWVSLTAELALLWGGVPTAPAASTGATMAAGTRKSLRQGPCLWYQRWDVFLEVGHS